MNTSSETRSSQEQEKVESGRQDAEPVSDALLELGKVTDTKGGWIGPKPEPGLGFQNY
ncbi:MAG TPA: hypothetical protein VMU52_03765 [Steroidobacteraceae bacterium]|nr:hypothetical protein [Steroidobacteraceae bacterium]